MTFTGAMRVHFNRHGAAPLVWCVATDAWEISVSHVRILAGCETRYQPKAKPDDEDGKPSAWFSVVGILTIDDHGVATINPWTSSPQSSNLRFISSACPRSRGHTPHDLWHHAASRRRSTATPTGIV